MVALRPFFCIFDSTVFKSIEIFRYGCSVIRLEFLSTVKASLADGAHRKILNLYTQAEVPLYLVASSGSVSRSLENELGDE